MLFLRRYKSLPYFSYFQKLITVTNLDFYLLQKVELSVFFVCINVIIDRYTFYQYEKGYLLYY